MLVVERTSFTDKTTSFAPFTRLVIGTGGALHRTDRFRFVDADTLLDEVTIDDPASIMRRTCRAPQGGALSQTRSHRSRAGWFSRPGANRVGTQPCGVRLEALRAARDPGRVRAFERVALGAPSESVGAGVVPAPREDSFRPPVDEYRVFLDPAPGTAAEAPARRAVRRY